MLVEIFNRQKELMKVIERRNGTTGTIPELACALISEVGEWLNEEQSMKFWKQSKTTNRDKELEELVDVLFFYIQIVIKRGFSPQQLFDAYIAKWEENIMRQRSNY